NCQGCHRSNDIHIGRNGTACEQCHNQRDWAPDFDHFSDTNFALQGAHAEVSCKACHIGKLTDAVNTECADCHAGSNPHGKLQGDCETCHGQTSWNDEISFHHDLSRFPLIGMHRVTSCEQCHQTLEYSPLAMACSHCHEQDDIHEGSLGEDCTGCHNPVSWSYWVFEHDEVSDFSLDGAHENLVCEACHTRGTSANRQSAACFACHSDDDPHKGRFSRQCDKCHNSSTFSEAHF
ncbi:MAG: hypothetical protein KUG75_13505, partial [Pseudomonadales bacterium]|nr:hypothetical protein [Pseudomonadales bacterium]